MDIVIREIRRIGIVIDADFFLRPDIIEELACARTHVQDSGIRWDKPLVEEMCAKYLPKCNLSANTFFAESSPINLSIDRHIEASTVSCPSQQSRILPRKERRCKNQAGK